MEKLYCYTVQMYCNLTYAGVGALSFSIVLHSCYTETYNQIKNTMPMSRNRFSNSTAEQIHPEESVPRKRGPHSERLEFRPVVLDLCYESTYLQLQRENEKDWHVVGLDLEPVEPMKRWRVNYTGDMVSHTSNTHCFIQPTTLQRPNFERNSDKSLKSFPPCYSQSPLQLCLLFLFLQTHAISYSFYSSFIVHCKGERRKT